MILIPTFNRFTEHPASVGQTWGEHARFALSASAIMAWASFAALVHAVAPPLFKTTTHNALERLYAMFVERET